MVLYEENGKRSGIEEMKNITVYEINAGHESP